MPEEFSVQRFIRLLLNKDAKIKRLDYKYINLINFVEV